MKTRPRLLLISLCAAAACQFNKGGTSSNPLPPPDPAVTPPLPPFAPLPPRAYAAKVKDLLTGLALQDDELAAVTANPQALGRLIDGWMSLPAFRSKMLDFFKKAFQQTQILPADLD